MSLWKSTSKPKILEGQTKQVVKLIQKDSELVAQTKKVDDAVKALKKALEKSSRSHKELLK